MENVFHQILVFAVHQAILEHFAMLLFVQMSMIAHLMVYALVQITALAIVDGII
jgi:hypothetical protein